MTGFSIPGTCVAIFRGCIILLLINFFYHDCVSCNENVAYKILMSFSIPRPFVAISKGCVFMYVIKAALFLMKDRARLNCLHINTAKNNSQSVKLHTEEIIYI